LANEHSIAWGCAQMARQMGAEVVASCLNDKARPFIEPLTTAAGIDLKTCNVEQPGELQALGSQRIRVHAVSPGPILTRAASGIAAFDELLENAIAKAPLGRLVTLDEIARLCTFLCTDASSGMTGQTIYVDAGCHAVA
jgi:enoyl-[acyl-carrier-protein] reductase (NADH)